MDHGRAPLWTAGEAARATGGTARGDWAADGVSIDTRTLGPGDLFAALTDARDGHDFAASAIARGAAAAMVSRIPGGVPDGAPLLVVRDVQDALAALGRAARARTRAKVIGVTGSAGKTSAKEMLRTALAAGGCVHAAEASHNNHWGVPLTLARTPAGSDFAVIEIGMNHPGEIAPLAAMARPDVALVTTVAAAHLEAFDGIEAIAREKGSIFAGLASGGTAVLNADLPTTPILRAAAADAETLSFGHARDAEFRMVSVDSVGGGTVCRADTPEGPLVYKIDAPGEHVAMNALGVLAAAGAAGADLALAAQALGRWRPPAGRGSIEEIPLDAIEGLTLHLVDDAFNANPASMAAALAVLGGLRPGGGRGSRGRRVAVLGDMLELGPGEERLHAGIAAHPAISGIDAVHCVGPRMRALHDALPADKRGLRVGTAEEMAERAGSVVDAGDVVLVKGSKGSRVSLVVDAIRNMGQPFPPRGDGGEDGKAG